MLFNSKLNIISKIGIRNMSVKQTILNKLSTHLKAVHVDVVNESYMHNVPKDSETHFKVLVVTDIFENLPLIKRHRMVNDVLKEELMNGVHALSIVALSPSQWEHSEKKIEPSPKCLGGFNK